MPAFIRSSLTKRVIVVTVTRAATAYNTTGNKFATAIIPSAVDFIFKYPSLPSIVERV